MGRALNKKKAAVGGARPRSTYLANVSAISPAPTASPVLQRVRALDIAHLQTPELQAWALSAGAVSTLPVDGLADKLALGRPLRIKLGLDPTAPDIHLGHTLVLERLRRFQDAGHEVVLIIGDFTARVGDPSGRSKTRPLLSEQAIATAAAGYAEQAFTILDRERTEIRFNSEWLDMSMAELFALARTTTLAQLLEREDFATRLHEHEPISMLEMLYPLIQGYDSVAVRADVEIGGTDQTFNLLLGRDIQRHFGVPEQVVMTLPLLVGVDGVKKMSKSVGNSIGITDAPEDVFAKTMSLPDAAMNEWFTLLFDSNPEPEHLPITRKRLLARSLAERIGGVGAGASAEAAFDRVHVHHQAPTDMPAFSLPDREPVHLPALLASVFGCSRAQARRDLRDGAVKIDGIKLDGETLDVDSSRLRGTVISLGKRRFARLS